MKHIQFEHRQERLLPVHLFVGRMFRYALISLGLVAFSVVLGMAGYHYTAGLSWLDSFYNACMILTGMGPASVLKTPAAKVFSSFYALYSGVAFLSISAVFLAPVAHRIMHILHLDLEDTDTEK